MARILYECNDLSVPAGGMRRLYRHVEILVESGFNAAILHHGRDYSNPWFVSSAPVVFLETNSLFAEDDVLVIPEGHVSFLRATQRLPCKRVVIALNWANIVRHLNPGETYASLDVYSVIAGGSYENEFLLRAMGITSTTIASGIDTTLFSPSTSTRCAITCMPRKNHDYYRIIVAIFRMKYPQYNWVPIIAIEMTPHIEVARLLSENAIFLAHTFPEGLSRKTLEAMASGNIVVGFAGGGSREFMIDRVNCYLADDGDLLEAGILLGRAIHDFLETGASEMRSSARKTAQSYSLEREAEAVTRYWTHILNTL